MVPPFLFSFFFMATFKKVAQNKGRPKTYGRFAPYFGPPIRVRGLRPRLSFAQRRKIVPILRLELIVVVVGAHSGAGSGAARPHWGVVLSLLVALRATGGERSSPQGRFR